MEDLLKKRLKLGSLKFKDWVIYEDDYLVVINKPKGISSLSERNDPQSGLLELAKKQYSTELQLCHRLDKMTTGVLIFAKNSKVYKNISLQFQKKQVKKLYWALVGGVHYFEDHEIRLPLKIQSNKVKVDFENGKKAITIVNTIYNFRNYTLVECEPVTGRTHQIRIHLALMKSPVVGDLEYGGQDLFLSDIKKGYKRSKNSEFELSLNHGYLLHAKRIEILHPQTNQPIVFEAGIPKNFKLCLDLLKKWNEY